VREREIDRERERERERENVRLCFVCATRLIHSSVHSCE